MENEHVSLIKHDCRVLIEMATYSKSMSIGAKAIIINKCENIMKELEFLEKDRMTRK